MKYVFFAAAIVSLLSVNAQDTTYARHLIDTLTSESFHGRGYTSDGVNLAKNFLENQFVAVGLIPLDGKKFSQTLSFDVNTFPSSMIVKINGHELRPGFDFIVAPESKGVKGTFELQQGDSIHYIAPKGKLIISLEEKLTASIS